MFYMCQLLSTTLSWCFSRFFLNNFRPNTVFSPLMTRLLSSSVTFQYAYKYLNWISKMDLVYCLKLLLQRLANVMAAVLEIKQRTKGLRILAVRDSFSRKAVLILERNLFARKHFVKANVFLCHIISAKMLIEPLFLYIQTKSKRWCALKNECALTNYWFETSVNGHVALYREAYEFWYVFWQ